MKKIITLSLVASFALAATPDTGQILRDTKIKQPKFEKELIELPKRIYKAPMKTLKGKIILVKKIIIENDGNIKVSILENLVKDYLNKELTLGQLNEVAGIITNYYRNKGYFVAKAYIPTQTIKNGIVKIVVVTGKFGKFTMQNKSLVNTKVIQGFMNELTSEKAVLASSLKRQLLLINDLSGVKVKKAEIFPGKAIGTSDFIIKTDKVEKYYSYTTLDNYGSKYTGRHILTLFGMINSPTKRGDSLSASGMISQGNLLKNGSLNYLTPVGYKGGKLGLNISNTTYKLGEDYSYLNATGETKTMSVTASYPYIKTKTHSVEISGAYNYKDLLDISQTNRTKKSVRSFDLTLNDERKTFFNDKAGKLVTNATLTKGQLSLDSAYAVSQDEAGLNSKGTYEKLSYSVNFSQAIKPLISFSASLKGQKALGKNLDSSEDFSLGGTSGVRAYNSGEVSGDNGYLASVETFYTLPAYKEIKNHKVSLFVDTGYVTINENNYNTDDNGRAISAIGIGYYASYKKLNITISLAHGFGSERTSTAESDISSNKLYMSLNYTF